MTSNDVLTILLAAADDADRVFDYAETIRWPDGAVQRFQTMGLLRAASNGLTAPCPNCVEMHIEPVTIREGPGGEQHFSIWCPESMRTDVQMEMCRGWEVDPDGLARAVAAALAIKGTPQVLVSNRLWRLGRIPWSDTTRPVVLALRLTDVDVATIACHIGQGGREILLVPRHVPDDRVWQGRVPAVVSLSHVAAVNDQALVLDSVAIVEKVAEADKTSAVANALSLDSPAKRMVRRQVKAEIKSLLTDDNMVAEYVKHRSFRKAAAALTKETGNQVTKDKIRRAVERRGGIQAIIPPEDSVSIARTVASQPRDRAKKVLERR